MIGGRPVSRKLRWSAGGLTVALVILSIPPTPPAVETAGAGTPFRWDAAELFAELEGRFERARRIAPDTVSRELERLTAEADGTLTSVAASERVPLEALGRLATLQFEMAVLGATDPTLLQEVADAITDSRRTVMTAAAGWPSDRPTHEALYRVIFGGRIALDEALVQAGLDVLPALRPIENVSSATPDLEVEGVRIHSGDILLSRGGAPTSALIARGNDFPNTFSHVALAHVDPETGEGTVIESLIEAGAVLTTVDEYLEAKRHRILVLRLRPDHPALAADPMLPHRAAERALEWVSSEHVPYDFAMDWSDPGAVFCSEIVYHPYRALGVELWSLKSPMSAPGLVDWLAAMGVREFRSLVPSDVEYDPQLRAVAEWRDAPALMDYRIDNAITDALLEEAERGGRLGYAWYALPPARMLKAFSLAEGLVGASPTIPAGMSAATALRVNGLVSDIHPVVRTELLSRSAAYRAERGYEAPYWTLVELARESLAALRTSLRPSLSDG